MAPSVYLCDVAFDWPLILQHIVQLPAGDAPNTRLSIEVFDRDSRETVLSKAHDILVRRAFSDCKSVHLLQMVDGLSGVTAYRVYAELSGGSIKASWPYLYFFKVGPREKIELEYARYQGLAIGYVPFHLGPRLRPERCGLGATEGYLTGDFVEEAEPLRDCARNGRANTVIAGLFNRTLRAWRNEPFTDSVHSLPQLLGNHHNFGFPKYIPEHRAPLIGALGGGRTLEELRPLWEVSSSPPVMTGPIHGDLHATNILARGSDAIVIDFERVEIGMPLLYDPAALEGGLLVDGFIGDKRPIEEILSSISPLYTAEALRAPPKLCHPTDPSSWYFQCIVQVRSYAHQLEASPFQYASALALTLLKKGCNKDAFGPRVESLRAAAYVLGERLVMDRVSA